MLHPILETSALNVILVATIKQRWYLGDALPAFALGAAFGPSAANLLSVPHAGSDESESTTSEVTYALARLVIGIQLVKAGYELPKRYLKRRLKEMTLCLLPIMAIGWITSSACIKLLVPHTSFLAALIIGSCVTCTDPILSQAIAKGPFSDNYVRRHLREFISAEAGGNDGFGFSFLLLGLALLRYADTPASAAVLEEFDLDRGGADLLEAADVGRFGGGAGEALKHWFVEGLLYMIILGGAYGATVGFVCRKVLTLSSKRKWIDPDSFTLVPVALGAFTVGSCGCFGSDETLACFIAGNMLNWDGMYNAELQARHDSFNSSLETILNQITLGAVMPWEEFHRPDATGITISRLLGLGVMILVFRRIPAIMAGYRFMPEICSNWKEALFLGHFGPIGVGAIAYVEYARRLFPDPGESDGEINCLTAAMRPVHGLSVPILYVIYKALRVPRVHDRPVEVVVLSKNEPLPNNSTVGRQRHSVLVNNRFSEPTYPSVLNNDSDDEKGSNNLRESCERIRPRSERSSMSYVSGTQISREASQRLSHDADPRNIV
ncbi:Sodium/hydrogen exchanger family-domain-containing protein [Aspergillus similis]